MADFSSIFQTMMDVFHEYTEGKETVKKEKVDINSHSFFEKAPVKKGIFSMGLTYISGSLLLLSNEIAEMSVSNPHQFAALAMLCPPLLSTAVYALGATYQIFKITGLILQKNPHETGSPEAIKWKNNRRVNITTRFLTMGACIALLGASLSPIPGVSNALGLSVLAGLVAMDLAKFAIKNLNARVAKRQQALLDYYKPKSILLEIPPPIIHQSSMIERKNNRNKDLFNKTTETFENKNVTHKDSVTDSQKPRNPETLS